MKISLPDVDVVVPVRIDTDDRLDNLATVLAYLRTAFDGLRVTVLEHDSETRAHDVAARYGASCEFFESAGCFHKSRVLNLGVALAERPYVLIYDCDVLCLPAALGEARRLLVSGAQDFVYPYNGLLLEIARDSVTRAFEDGDRGKGSVALLATLPQRVADRSAKLPAAVQFLHGSAEEPSSGAALMANRRRLLLAGGYNENIVSYGCEDTELATRLMTLGERVTWIDGYSAYHIAHRRGGDSRYNNFHAANLAEWNKVRAMNRATLQAYVRNGFRELALDSHRNLTITNTREKFALEISTPAKAALDDVAFVLLAPAATAATRAWTERFFDELDAAYDNFELYLVESGAYEFQAHAHRDHVLYVHAASSAEDDCVRPIVEKSARAFVCLCSPLTDVSPAVLLPVLDEIRRSPEKPAALPARAPGGADGARSARIADVVLKSLPVSGDALLFARASYLAGAPAEHATRLDVGTLRRRLEATHAARRERT
jgi:hypothetical protein